MVKWTPEDQEAFMRRVIQENIDGSDCENCTDESCPAHPSNAERLAEDGVIVTPIDRLDEIKELPEEVKRRIEEAHEQGRDHLALAMGENGEVFEISDEEYEQVKEQMRRERETRRREAHNATGEKPDFGATQFGGQVNQILEALDEFSQHRLLVSELQAEVAELELALKSVENEILKRLIDQGGFGSNAKEREINSEYAMRHDSEYMDINDELITARRQLLSAEAETEILSRIVHTLITITQAHQRERQISLDAANQRQQG